MGATSVPGPVTETSICSTSPAPFEKSFDNRRRKGATPQPLRNVRLLGDQYEEGSQDKDGGRERHSDRHTRLASRQSRKKPKDAVQPGQRSQMATKKHNNIAGVAKAAVRTPQ
jgi:hypothetical protein